jgi:UDP-3-O-[3-hydroxymyristoyl] glucosamine N-acyltransferase
MKFNRTYSLQEIAQVINCECVGDLNFSIYGMNEIHVVENGDIVFVDHPKYYEKALNSAASVILINKKDISKKSNEWLVFVEVVMVFLLCDQYFYNNLFDFLSTIF